MPKRKEMNFSTRRRSQRFTPDPKEIASRSRSLDWGGLITYLPNPDKVLSNLGRTQRVWDDIKHDPHLTSVISSRKAGVKSMLWEIDRGKSKSRQAKAVINAFKAFDVNRTINDILDYSLTGLAPLEVMWSKPSVNDGFIFPYEVIGKPPEWFMYDGNNILKFRSVSHPSDGEDLPLRKILNPRHNPTYKNPYGQSLLSVCYWPVIFKFGGQKFWLKFIEKFGMPFAVGKIPRSAGQTEFDKMAELLEDLVQDAVAAIPNDAEVEFLEASQGKASSDIYQGMLKFMNMEISKAILGQTLTTEAGDKGARALGQVHFDVRADIILDDQRVVENIMNQLIAWMMFMNFGQTKDLPKFTLYKEQDIEKDRADRDKTLADTGQVQFTQQYMEAAYGFQKGDIIVKPAATQEIVEDTGTEKAKAKFAEQISKFKDQEAVDQLLNSQTDEELQKQVSFMKPIFDIFNESNDYNEALKKLSNIFTELDSSRLEDVLKRAIFVTEMWGRLNQGE